MARKLLSAILLAITASPGAQTLSGPSFRMEIPDGWEQSNDESSDGGSVFRLADPGDRGFLKLRSFDVPGFVTREALRNLTNLDVSIPLAWTAWGDYSGYQYNYIEKEVHYRQWWLASERTILLITYQRSGACDNFDSDLIDRIVNSIRVLGTQDTQIE